MSRKAAPAPASKATPANEKVIAEEVSAANQLAAITLQAHEGAVEMAKQLGYEGALTQGALEDEIRFYQRRTVEACLELGKRLLLLKKMTPHGEFEKRAELLGFSDRSAQRFMQAAAKTAKSANLALLSSQVKSVSAFLELVTQDDDTIKTIAEMDDIDRLSPTELRAKLREARAEKIADESLIADKAAKIDKLSRRIRKADPDQVSADLQKEATAICNDAVGAIKGGLRQALIALHEHGGAACAVFMAGLVGQVQADLTALREEFQLPDVSTAADRQLAGEVAQWAGKDGH